MTPTVFLKSFFARFARVQTTTFAASVAVYTTLTLAPMLLLFVTLTSRMTSSYQAEFEYQVLALLGADAAEAINTIVGSIVSNAKARPDLATFSGVIGTVMLLLSSGLVFGELRVAINRIFETTNPPDDSETTLEVILHFVRDRLIHVGFALVFIGLMAVSLLLSSFLSSAFSSSFSADPSTWKAFNVVASFFFYAGLFALVFRYLPNRRTQWRGSLLGGFITSILFVIGKELIGLYLGQSALGSAYGAAGSVVVLLAWVYYSAMITFVGAHVSAMLLLKKTPEGVHSRTSAPSEATV